MAKAFAVPQIVEESPWCGIRQSNFVVSVVHGGERAQNGGNTGVFNLGAAVENSVHIELATSQTNRGRKKSAEGGFGPKPRSGFVTAVWRATYNDCYE
jgi:hypothetical protein